MLVALDITPEVIEEAMETGAQLIVAHHPVIWDKLGRVTDESVTGRKILTLIEHGLAAKGIIAGLLQGFAVDYLTTTDLAFRCQCSKERISEVLLSLGKTDLESLIEDGHAEVCCHFCNERYEFSKEELQAIYDKAMANRSHAEA